MRCGHRARARRRSLNASKRPAIFWACLERTDRDELVSYPRRGIVGSTPYVGVANLTGEWFTYKQAAELLNVSSEADRHRAMRGRWERTIGNDKRIRVRLPDGWSPDDRPNKRAVRILDERVPSKRVTEALKAHVETLKAHVETLKAHIETLTAQLGAADRRAEKQAAEFAAREARYAADLTGKRTLADQTSARVDQMTAELALEKTRREKARHKL